MTDRLTSFLGIPAGRRLTTAVRRSAHRLRPWEYETKRHMRLYWWGIYLAAFSGWLSVAAAALKGVL